jgi:hypothetical protein
MHARQIPHYRFRSMSFVTLSMRVGPLSRGQRTHLYSALYTCGAAGAAGHAVKAEGELATLDWSARE